MKSRPPFLLPVSLLTIIILSFLITGTANAETYSVLYRFQGGKDGGVPYGGLVRDSAGNLYGTTSGNGAHSMGTIFMLDSAGNETVLYRFTDGADGASPQAGLVLDSAGNLYGTAGGGNGYGVIFRFDPAGTLTVLHTFDVVSGGSPTARLIRDTDGNLYGTTTWGGSTGFGGIFKLDANGNFTILYQFTGGADGGAPNGPLVRDSDGNLYGVTTDYYVCCNYHGRVFKLDTSGVLTVLYLFTGGADGSEPIGGLIRDAAGNLYGATQYGGDFTCDSIYGCGVVFKVDPSGVETVLHTFATPPDANFPSSGLLADGKGNLFGAALSALYKMNLATGAETAVHSVGRNSNGVQPWGTLIGDGQGNMYGTAAIGGTKSSLCKNGCGVVYKLSHQ